jgi:hypothetical protein
MPIGDTPIADIPISGEPPTGEPPEPEPETGPLLTAVKIAGYVTIVPQYNREC